ncbi:hypothetical protein ABIA70_003221 [Arthrobacter sp. 754]
MGRAAGPAEWQTGAMSIEQWWPKLKPATREWLMQNNGDAVPAGIVSEIADAGGNIDSSAWWVGQSDGSGFYFSDQAIDWIEAVANGETPESP